MYRMHFPRVTRISRFAVYLLVVAVAMSTAACDSSDNEPEGPGLGGNDLEAEGGRGTEVEIPLSLQAEAGIQSLSVAVNGGSSEDVEVDAGAVEQELTYTFAIPADADLGTEYSLVFTLTDEAGGTSNIMASVVTTKLIETPATYEFTRDGESTVAYPGQTDRLNMVDEIDDYIALGDDGQQLSEQALLDMFENAGGNGGGHFSFTSDRQLKDKTFPPDLDDGLFEDLFAGAAAASVSGETASSGIAGLVTRENSGNTILVDENGREFGQLIQKGLMGAVFLNQIYNVYLTDERIGEGVENVETAEGANYTDMEHHWDEAFGYFDPPVDFTSDWPEARADELRYWSNYSDEVDNVAGGQLGTNQILMDAYKEGRAAIVNNDPATRDEQRDILYATHELVAAAVTVHYINSTLSALDAGNTGEALHTLSEAWAFANALKYSPQRRLTIEEIEKIMEEDFGADGDFWNVTPAGLNEAKSTLVETYSELAPVQDDL